eukprot:193811_1
MRAQIIFWLVMMEHTQTTEVDCILGGCGDATLRCSSGEDCTVLCGSPTPVGEDGIQACRRATVNCPTDANCDVFCFKSACEGINVNCPTTGNCYMMCDESACLFADVTWSPVPYRNTLQCYSPYCPDLTVPPTGRPIYTSTPTSVTQSPTAATSNPTAAPTMIPSQHTSSTPSDAPTNDPSSDPTFDPTNDTTDPTSTLTSDPTLLHTVDPTMDPTFNPTVVPTLIPTINPTKASTTVFPTLRIDDPTETSTKLREQEVIEKTVDVSTTSVRASPNIGSEDEAEQLKVVIVALGGVLSVIILVGIAFAVYMCMRKKEKGTEKHIPIELRNAMSSHVVNMQSNGEARQVGKAGPGRNVDPGGLPALPDEGAKCGGMDDDAGELNALMAPGDSDENEDLFGSGPVTKEEEANKGGISSDSDDDALFYHQPDNDKQTKQSAGGHQLLPKQTQYLQ